MAFRVLVILPFPWSYSRPRSRNFWPRIAAQPDTEVTVIAHAGGDGDLPALPVQAGLTTRFVEVGRLGAVVRTGLRFPTGQSLRLSYADSPALHRAVIDAYREFRPHVVYVERLRGFPATRGIPANEVVIDQTDSLPLFYQQVLDTPGVPFVQRLIARVEGPRFARAEGRAYPTAGAVIACTPRDAEAMARDGHREAIDVIANGVDLREYYPAADRPPGDPRHLVMTGNFRTLPNTDAALWLASEWPRIRERLGAEASLTFAGGNPPPALQQAHGRDGVSVTGYVPTLRDAYWQAGIAAVPVRLAVGTQNKLIEPLACGTLVVATPEAVAGLPEDGRAAVTVARREEFADAIAALVADPDRQALLRQRALDFVRTQLDWDILAVKLRGVLERVAERAHTSVR
ncbi:MAG: glycosyltransferase [Dehalococcoidia bacterium]|nr:MAG: glycosyltransferase [Dehalococcoidia bacterium]